MNAALPSWTGVAASAVLVAVAAVITYRRRLGITRELLVAAARAAVQLAAVGAILLALFRHTGLVGSFAWVAGMVVVAGQVAGRRARGLPSARVAASIGVAVGSALTLATLLTVRIVPVEPRVVVPVGGMIVAGGMQASALALMRLRDEARQRRAAIEARLALGLPATEALDPHLRTALHTGLVPALDGAKVVGLISLPGAMTGLILAGVPPLTAIRYQIVVMYMLLATAAVAALVASEVARRALFDQAHRLRSL